MDKEVYEVRLAGWKQVVQQCQERPAGTTQKEWLAQNEIPEAQFYYWLRKVRKEALTEIAAASGCTIDQQILCTRLCQIKFTWFLHGVVSCFTFLTPTSSHSVNRLQNV